LNNYLLADAVKSQSDSGDDYGTPSSAKTSSHSRNSIRTRLQKVRYGRGNSTPHSVRMPCNQVYQGKIVRETTTSTWRSNSGKKLGLHLRLGF